MGNVSRTQSSNNATSIAAREAAAKRAAELAAERARKAAEAARKAAEAAKRQAAEAQAKLQEALQKPNASPKEVSKLREASTQAQQKADAAEQLAQQKEAASVQADTRAGITRPQGSTPTDASTFSANQTSQLLGGQVQTSVAASNDAKFVAAAAQNGNGAEALASALEKNPNDPVYANQLIAESKGAVEQDLRTHLECEPEKGRANVNRYLAALPPEQRAAALESLKPALLASVQSKAGTDPVAAANELKQLVEAMPDAASRKALIEGARESITQMITTGAQSGTPQQNEELLKALAAAGNLAGPEGMKAMTDAVAQGWPTQQAHWQSRDLSLSNPLAVANFNNQLNNPFDVGPFTRSLAQSLDETGKTDVAQGIRDSAAMVSPNSLIHGAKSKYDTAKANVEQNNQRLQQQLGRLGPNLTEAQRQQYVRDFNNQPQVKADLEQLQQSSKDLGAVLEKVASSPESKPETIQLATEAAKELAKSPTGAVEAKDAAVALIKRLQTEPGIVADPAGLQTQLEQVIQDSAPNVYQEMLRRSGGDRNAAAQNFAAQFDFLEQNRNIFSNLQPLQKAVDAIRNDDLNALKDIGSDNKFSKTFRSLGLAFSVAKLAGGPNDDAEAFIKEVANGGKEGLELLAEVMKTYGKGLQLSRNAERAALIEKFTPGLALVANALSTHMDIVKYQSRNGNWGDLVSLIGNATATLGSAMEVTGIGAAPGKLLQTIGSITAGIGGLASTFANESAMNEEMRSMLAKQPELDGIHDQLLQRDVTRLAEKTGMSGEDVQRLIRTNPELFENPTKLWRFVNVAEASRLKGPDILALAEKAKANPYMLADLGSEPPGVIRSLLWFRYPEVRELLQARGLKPGV